MYQRQSEAVLQDTKKRYVLQQMTVEAFMETFVKTNPSESQKFNAAFFDPPYAKNDHNFLDADASRKQFFKNLGKFLTYPGIAFLTVNLERWNLVNKGVASTHLLSMPHPPFWCFPKSRENRMTGGKPKIKGLPRPECVCIIYSCRRKVIKNKKKRQRVTGGCVRKAWRSPTWSNCTLASRN